MAFYLVRAEPNEAKLDVLREELEEEKYVDMQPFGPTVSHSLRNARWDGDEVVWEEEDYCRPPLAEERAAVLDAYFDNLRVEDVEEGEGWERIEELPYVFPGLAGG